MDVMRLMESEKFDDVEGYIEIVLRLWIEERTTARRFSAASMRGLSQTVSSSEPPKAVSADPQFEPIRAQKHVRRPRRNQKSM
jgi:hypothetical protein